MSAKNILYAEDNPDDAFILKIALKRAAVGGNLWCVDDGECAIEWLRGDGEFADRQKHPLPDLLVLDLKMPRRSGFEVLEWVKNAQGFENLPVVILSSSDDPRDLKRASELHVDKYFKKTPQNSEIVDFLKQVS